MCIACISNLNVINEWASAFVASIRTPPLTEFMIFVTDIGNPLNLTMLCVALALALWLHKKMHHLVQFIATLLVSQIVSLAIKFAVKLPRPAGGLIPETGYSFASGHAITATIFFLLIAYSYKSHIKSSFLRKIFIFINCLLAFLIGISRVYLGVHYATDVLFGFLVGLTVFAISVLALQSYERSNPVIESKA